MPEPDDGSAGPPPGSLGALGEEATRFVGLVQAWTRANFPAGPDGHVGAECEWCPVCQFMAVLRGERPEVSARVAEAGAAVATAFRAVIDSTASAAGRPSGGSAPADPPPPRVQRIDLLGSEPDLDTDADGGVDESSGR